MCILGSTPGSVTNFYMILGEITFTPWALFSSFVNLGHLIKSSQRSLSVLKTLNSDSDQNLFLLFPSFPIYSHQHMNVKQKSRPGETAFPSDCGNKIHRRCSCFSFSTYNFNKAFVEYLLCAWPCSSDVTALSVLILRICPIITSLFQIRNRIVEVKMYDELISFICGSQRICMYVLFRTAWFST